MDLSDFSPSQIWHKVILSLGLRTNRDNTSVRHKKKKAWSFRHFPLEVPSYKLSSAKLVLSVRRRPSGTRRSAKYHLSALLSIFLNWESIRRIHKIQPNFKETKEIFAPLLFAFLQKFHQKVTFIFRCSRDRVTVI